jgi:amino acid transporter
MDKKQQTKRTIGYWSAVAIGVGGMVGGGIFAVLGLAVQLAGGGTPVAFLLAGLVALITSYSYAKLSVTFPSRGGTVEFINQAFGSGIMTGGLNILLWLSYIVMLSLYAYAFGSYGASLFSVTTQLFWRHIFISSIIILLTGLNIIGAKAVGKSEEWIVGGKITILLLFIYFGFWHIKYEHLAINTWTNSLQLIAGGMIIFLAYEGFELIANTAKDIKNPRKNLPKAYYSSIIFVIVLYILVSMVVVGNLSLGQIIQARDYALAVSAQPFLGDSGFLLIAIAALMSTASAINATLYGSSRVSYIIARDGELPKMLDKKIWNKPIEGLLITAGLTLLVANFFDLSSISIMGSAGFLIIFMAVNIANIKLKKKTKSHLWIPILGTLVCFLALVALIWQIALTSPTKILVLVFLVGVSFSMEIFYRHFTQREIKSLINNK